MKSCGNYWVDAHGMVLADVAVVPSISWEQHHDCSDYDCSDFHIQSSGQSVLYPGSIKFLQVLALRCLDWIYINFYPASTSKCAGRFELDLVL